MQRFRVTEDDEIEVSAMRGKCLQRFPTIPQKCDEWCSNYEQPANVGKTDVDCKFNGGDMPPSSGNKYLSCVQTCYLRLHVGLSNAECKVYSDVLPETYGCTFESEGVRFQLCQTCNNEDICSSTVCSKDEGNYGCDVPDHADEIRLGNCGNTTANPPLAFLDFIANRLDAAAYHLSSVENDYVEVRLSPRTSRSEEACVASRLQRVKFVQVDNIRICQVQSIVYLVPQDIFFKVQEIRWITQQYLIAYLARLVSSSTDMCVILVWSAKLQQNRLRQIALGALRDKSRLAKIAMIVILEDLVVLSTPISATRVLVVSLRA
eukprot:g1123.t1